MLLKDYLHNFLNAYQNSLNVPKLIWLNWNWGIHFFRTFFVYLNSHSIEIIITYLIFCVLQCLLKLFSCSVIYFVSEILGSMYKKSQKGLLRELREYECQSGSNEILHLHTRIHPHTAPEVLHNIIFIKYCGYWFFKNRKISIGWISDLFLPKPITLYKLCTSEKSSKNWNM